MITGKMITYGTSADVPPVPAVGPQRRCVIARTPAACIPRPDGHQWSLPRRCRCSDMPECSEPLTEQQTAPRECSRKRVQQLKKREKSCFLDFQKNVKNLCIIFHCCLMFIVPLHCCQNLTSFTLDVQQWLRMDHTRRSGNWITVITDHRAKYVSSFRCIED